MICKFSIHNVISRTTTKKKKKYIQNAITKSKGNSKKAPNNPQKSRKENIHKNRIEDKNLSGRLNQ